jgi:hypothetical protein
VGWGAPERADARSTRPLPVPRCENRAAEERVILQRFVAPVPLPRRVVATPADWAATGARVAAMLRAGEDRRVLARRSFWLDVHIAQLCRARGITLLTDDGVHARVARHVRHSTAPLPA